MAFADLLVGKELPLRMLSSHWLFAKEQEYTWEAGKVKACPAITDPSLLPCSGQRTALSSWTVAVPSPEGEPLHSR